MDKRVIFAVAGSGKTTYIINRLSKDKRALVVTYTEANYTNLYQRIIKKFDGVWPENITLMTYFTFLYQFCYKPFLSDKYKAAGICYDQRLVPQYAQKTSRSFFITANRYLYSNRLAFLLEQNFEIDNIRSRIMTYFDDFIIDEVQDIAGRDFNFIEHLMSTDVDMLFVGDFYQHTFDTSRDGNVNAKLFENIDAYKKRFEGKGLAVDPDSLSGSWRCSKNICDYITTSIGISIFSARPDADNTSIEYVSGKERISAILHDEEIIKLHFQKAALAGAGHKNWGQTKGEDHYQDVCVLLNKTTAKARSTGKLNALPSSTKNKLYVALTRARGNVYLVDEP